MIVSMERKAFEFRKQKINLHIKRREFEPKAHTLVPGALDLCLADSPGRLRPGHIARLRRAHAQPSHTD